MIFAVLLSVAFTASSDQLGDSSSNQPDDESVISVQHRFSGIVCAGVCTDSDLTVRHNGLVEFRVRSFGGPWRTHKYRVSPDQIERFWRAYAAIRPEGLKGPVGTCVPETAIIDFEIHWNES
ncbi:MAG TPA: hypothetical protein VNS11_08705, partial [Sphingomicrobium sp.]|nr:hypothetical protein [Sphingomicrobium sp.]